MKVELNIEHFDEKTLIIVIKSSHMSTKAEKQRLLNSLRFYDKKETILELNSNMNNKILLTFNSNKAAKQFSNSFNKFSENFLQ